jgi:hypothetical protein
MFVVARLGCCTVAAQSYSPGGSSSSNLDQLTVSVCHCSSGSVSIWCQLLSPLFVPKRSQLSLYIFLEFAKDKSRRANSYRDEEGRCLNRSRTTRMCVCSAQLPSDLKSSQQWADPTHHLGQTVHEAPTAPRNQDPDRIPSRAPNSPRPSP